MYAYSLSHIYIYREREIDIAIDTDTDRDVDIDLGKYNIVRRTMLCGDSTNIQLCTYVHTYVHAYIQKHIYIYICIYTYSQWRPPVALRFPEMEVASRLPNETNQVSLGPTV